MDLDGVFEDGEAELMRDLEGSTAEDVTMRTRLLENEIRVLRDESNRLALDLQSDKERVKENMEKIKMNKQLPYLVGNVVEILDLKPEVRRFGSRQKVPRSSARGQAPRGRIVRSGRAPKEGRSGPHGPHAELADPQACALRPHLPPNHERRRGRRRRMAATSTSTRGDRAKPWCSRPPPGRPSFCPSSAWSTEVRFWCTLFIFSSSLLLASARRATRRFLQTVSDTVTLSVLFTRFSNN